MWMPTVWAAQPMRRGRTPSGLLDELESLGLDEELEDPGENTVVLMEWGEQMAPRSISCFAMSSILID